MALEDLYEFMEGRPCALLLTDESGCLLARTGHPDTLQALAALGFGPGAFFSEGRIGTNAVNLAALEGCRSASAAPSTSTSVSTPGTAVPALSTTAPVARWRSWP